ncbi:MAG: dTDP-4-dehydrorhamnose 3,5-epimerase family protein [Fimbriimonadaceae bacterium]|nr:dTDP-4-dehydrorhamnose 3,5-epimerase family protein [Fimbriimonadaceae bacterium]
MPFQELTIPGVWVNELSKYVDQRGWLTELFREDELPEWFKPAMCYLSVTHPGIARGPHEHVDQTDGFAFISGAYELYLWENREGKPDQMLTLAVGEENPLLVLVPPGVVHAYRNVGTGEAFVLNFPNQLYAGRGKKEPVDEIRHEEETESRFRLP